MFGSWTSYALALAALAVGGCATHHAQRDPAARAEARAIGFLQREVPAWPRENGCFSCHNNGDAARALYAAGQKGYRVPAQALADTTAWVARPRSWEDNQGDPGFSDQRLANLQFAVALLAAIEAGKVTDRRPLQEAARKLAADQDADGAWHIERPGTLGSPTTYGAPLATYLALRALEQAGAPGTSEAIGKARKWLRQASPGNVPAAAALLLASARLAEEPARGRQAECLQLIRRAQTPDGGWGPYPDSPPEPFDTAIVLLALAGLPPAADTDELIRRGRGYLAAQQQPDGSWAATTRPPGGNSYAQQMSTTGWAALALLATRDVAK